MESYKQIINKIPNSAFNWGDSPALILLDKNGNRWFLGVDVSRALGYYKIRNAIDKHVSPENIVRFGNIRNKIITKVSGRVRDDWRFLNEKGVYEYIDTSNRKEYAKKLKAKYF